MNTRLEAQAAERAKQLSENDELRVKVNDMVNQYDAFSKLVGGWVHITGTSSASSHGHQGCSETVLPPLSGWLDGWCWNVTTVKRTVMSFDWSIISMMTLSSTNVVMKHMCHPQCDAHVIIV